MAFDSESGMIMPVAPTGNFGGGFGNSFGNDGWWIILLFLLLVGNNGWGNGYSGGNAGFVDTSVQRGFDQAAVMNGITGIQGAVTSGFGDVQTALCSGFSGVEIGANARQMANMQQMFGLQSQFADCCCENRLGIADLKYTVATENCEDRTQALMNTRDIIDSQSRGTQAILDKLCALELDGLKQDNANLRTQLNMANLAASQIKQTADIQSNIVNELRSCPIPAQPVYGSQPIFTCGGNTGCGCGGSF